MPIPTAFDRQLAEIENLGASVLVMLRTMKHANPATRERQARVVRERLQEYCDAVIETANAVVAETL